MTEKTAESIREKAEELVRRFGTRDPLRISRALGIHILKVDSLRRLKGFYRVIKRNRFIFLNAKNSPRRNRIVCGHELGHDLLHREFAEENIMDEFSVSDLSSRREYEANLFLAELLLPDDEMLEYIKDGMGVREIARATASDVSLVALKCESLIRRGYDLIPQGYDASFLRTDKRP